LLESIRWVSEIIIVDDDSVDQTREIAQSYGATIVRHQSCGDFDAQRNRGIAQASQEWVLQLDADEVVSADLREEIERQLLTPGSFDAFRITRRNHFLGHEMRYGGWAGQQGVKLFRKGRARYVGHSVHETLQVDGPIGSLNHPVDHYPFQSIEEFIERQNFYTSVEARVMLGHRGRLPSRVTLYQAAVRPVKLFWKFYVKKQGHRDGWHGLVFSLLFAFTHFMLWIKYWEILQAGSSSGKRSSGATRMVESLEHA